MKNKVYWFGLMIFCMSCVSTKDFTALEKKQIYSNTADSPFRVLQTTSLSDSLFLRKKTKDIDFSKSSAELSLLISRMKKTMEVESGVGIAAPQIGISRSVFLLVRTDKPGFPVEAIINPKIISRSPETVCFERDGCLSIPDVSGNSVRYAWIEVEYLTENGQKVRETISGHSRKDNFASVIFQHEFDHLQGVLFTDKLCR